MKRLAVVTAWLWAGPAMAQVDDPYGNLRHYLQQYSDDMRARNQTVPTNAPDRKMAMEHCRWERIETRDRRAETNWFRYPLPGEVLTPASPPAPMHSTTDCVTIGEITTCDTDKW